MVKVQVLCISLWSATCTFLSSPLYFLRFLNIFFTHVILSPEQKAPVGDAQQFSCCPCGQLAALPTCFDFAKPFRQHLAGPAKFHATRLRCGDPFRLPLVNEFALCLRHIG